MLKLLIVLAVLAIAAPFAAAYHLNTENREIPPEYVVEAFETDASNGQIGSLSLKNFTAFKRLGFGGFAKVFLAKKNGGLDDGQLYALKAIDIECAIEFEGSDHEESLNNEREILEEIKDLPYVTKLHYAFFEGKWAFLVLDLVTGGEVQQRLFDKTPNETTAQLILAEIITLIEKLHNANIFHRDLSYSNVLIDSDGHFILTDFGFSSRRTNNDSFVDWNKLPGMCRQLFPTNIIEQHQRSLIELFENVTDSRLSEVKNHPYFNGIDWNKVADGTIQRPYEAHSIEIDYDKPLDLVKELEMDANDTLDASVLKRLRNYGFVAPQHQF